MTTSTVNGKFTSDVRAAALRYAARGWKAVPNHVPDPTAKTCSCGNPRCSSQGKHPLLKGWAGNAAGDAEAVARLFNGKPVNVGAVVGPDSGNLADVDLDCEPAVLAGEYILPPTGSAFGRGGLVTHGLYVATGGAEYLKLIDPILSGSAATVVELRWVERDEETGELKPKQTVLPPSLHLSGERIAWTRDDDPAEVPGADLVAAVKRVGAAVLIARYVRPPERHALILLLANLAVRAGLDDEAALDFIRGVFAAKKDREKLDKINDGEGAGALKDARGRFKAGKHMTGIPKLKEWLDPAVTVFQAPALIAKIAAWVGLTDSVRSVNSVPGEWPDPVPLGSPPAVPPFPVEVLPDWLRKWAEAQAVELQVPVDLPALLGLGIVSGGIGRKVVVGVRDGFTEPTNLFVMPAMEPGERKTQAFAKAMVPVQELERELREAARPDIAEKESDLRVAEAKVKHLETRIAKLGKDDAGEKEKLVEELKAAREELLKIDVPPPPVLFTEDDTPPALKSELIRQGGRMMVASTEAKIIENITRFSDQPDFDIFLKGHAGDEVKTGRIGRGRESVTDPALTCVISPQPAVIQGMAETPALRGRGFLARWFYALPTSKVGFRAVASPAVPAAVRSTYRDRVKAVWKGEYARDESNAPAAHVLTFSPAADAELRHFEGWVETQLRPGGVFAHMAGWGNKLVGLCVRVAAALHVGDCEGAGRKWADEPIPVGVVGRAVRVAKEYAIPHAVAAFDLMGTNPTVAGARRIWKWVVAEKLTEFSKRDCQRGNRTFDNVDQLQPCLDLLERHYLIRPKVTDEETPRRGRPASPVYEVNPKGGDDPTPPTEPPPRPDPPTDEIPPDTPRTERTERTETPSDPTPEDPEPDSVLSVLSVPGGTAVHADGCTLIADADGVAHVAAVVEDHGGPVGLDCETVNLGGKKSQPDPRRDKVRLIQVAVGADVFVIDVFKLADPGADLARLFEALGQVEVIAHSAQFELRFLTPLGFVPGRVFCTKIASQVLHHGAVKPDDRSRDHDLAAVARREINRDLDKSFQTSDWSGVLSPGQLRYAATDAEVMVPLAEALRKKIADAHLTRTFDLEMGAMPGVAWAAPVTVERDGWLALATAAEAEQTRLAEEMDGLVPNPGTLTASRNWNAVGDIIEAFRAVGVKLADTGDDVLAATAHPLAGLVRDYRSAAKRAGTYGKKWLRENAPDGTVAPSWNQIGAESGRMSCSRPNLQQVPRTADYRRCFVARPGHLLIKADYSQVELRIAARIADEEGMILAYRSGQDLHTRTASLILDKEMGDVTKGDRQLAKAINFGLLFGMGWKSLRTYAFSNYGVALTDGQAKAYREAFFEAYPGLARWHRSVEKDVKAKARCRYGRTYTAWTRGGRRRVVPAVKRTADGAREYPNLNEALNTPVQGTGADGLKAAIGLLWERRVQCPGAVPVLFCHDEVVVEAPEAMAPQAADWLRRCMVDGMQPLIDPVPVEVDVSIGKTWGGD